MKRTAVLKKIKNAAQRQGKTFETVELTNHTGVIVDGLRSTLARHTEIDDITAQKFFKQFATVLGEKWWR